MTSFISNNSFSFQLLSGGFPKNPNDRCDAENREIINICRYRSSSAVPPFLSAEDLYTAPMDETLILVDAYLVGQGLNALGSLERSGWEEADGRTATGVLARMLTHTFAYEVVRCSKQRALEIASAFVGRFSPFGRFLLSADLYDLKLEDDGFPPVSWRAFSCARSLSDWTFGAGLIAFDDVRIGIYYLQDED